MGLKKEHTKERITITINNELLKQLDELVEQNFFQNRSVAVEEAVNYALQSSYHIVSKDNIKPLSVILKSVVVEALKETKQTKMVKKK